MFGTGLQDAGFRQVVRQRSVLRVGYVEARPWSYRAAQGVLGLDTMAVSIVARKMGCAIEYEARAASVLAEGLLNDEYDLAIGGLLAPRHQRIVGVAVPHAPILASADRLRSRYRRAFFPNVWWLRRHDLALRYRIALTLLPWRLGMDAHLAVGARSASSEASAGKTALLRLRRG